MSIKGGMPRLWPSVPLSQISAEWRILRKVAHARAIQGTWCSQRHNTSHQQLFAPRAATMSPLGSQLQASTTENPRQLGVQLSNQTSINWNKCLRDGCKLINNTTVPRKNLAWRSGSEINPRPSAQGLTRQSVPRPCCSRTRLSSRSLRVSESTGCRQIPPSATRTKRGRSCFSGDAELIRWVLGPINLPGKNLRYTNRITP